LRIPDSVLYKIIQNTDIHNLLGRLLEGEIFEGRVVSVDGNFLLMQLLDGSRITAQVESGAKYNPGDIIKLKVVDRQQGRLIAVEDGHSPVKDSKPFTGETGHFSVQNSLFPSKSSENSTVRGREPLNETGHITVRNNVPYEKANNPDELLKSANIPVNRLNIDVVRAIVSMGSEPKAEIIEKAVNLMNNTQVDNPRHAVFLVLNRMDDKEQFYEIISELDRGRFHFSEELNNLVDLLEEASAETDDSILAGVTERIRAALANSLVKTVLNRSKYLQKDEAASDGNPEKIQELALPKADKWLYDLKKELSLLGKILTDSAANNREKILSAVNRLETAIHFFNELRGIEMFVQVPFIVRDNQINGELYIMKRAGRKGKINSRDFTLFLSLSTEYIGRLDIFVHVKNKNVMVRIFTENEKFNHLFTDEYRTLYDALREKGYKLFDMDFQSNDEKISIFNAEKTASEILDMNRTKIDVKV